MKRIRGKRLRVGALGFPAPRTRVHCVLLSAVLLGCTAPAKYFVAPGHKGAPGVRRVLLCPMNVAVSLPPEIGNGGEPLHRKLVDYLESLELEVDRLGLVEARSDWVDAGSASEQKSSEEAGGIFARHLAERREFDVVIMPSLVLRTVRVTDSSGTWDGVRRRVSMVNAPSRGMGGSADTFSKGVAFGGITGDVTAASLHVIAFSRDGERVFEGTGGLDFVQEIDLAAASGYKWNLGLDPIRLRNPEVMHRGVELALGPYLPPHDD